MLFTNYIRFIRVRASVAAVAIFLAMPIQLVHSASIETTLATVGKVSLVRSRDAITDVTYHYLRIHSQEGAGLFLVISCANRDRPQLPIIEVEGKNLRLSRKSKFASIRFDRGQPLRSEGKWLTDAFLFYIPAKKYPVEALFGAKEISVDVGGLQARFEGLAAGKLTAPWLSSCQGLNIDNWKFD